jgi:hypothetical protein
MSTRRALVRPIPQRRDARGPRGRRRHTGAGARSPRRARRRRHGCRARGSLTEGICRTGMYRRSPRRRLFVCRPPGSAPRPRRAGDDQHHARSERPRGTRRRMGRRRRPGSGCQRQRRVDPGRHRSDARQEPVPLHGDHAPRWRDALRPDRQACGARTATRRRGPRDGRTPGSLARLGRREPPLPRSSSAARPDDGRRSSRPRAGTLGRLRATRSASASRTWRSRPAPAGPGAHSFQGTGSSTELTPSAISVPRGQRRTTCGTRSSPPRASPTRSAVSRGR